MQTSTRFDYYFPLINGMKQFVAISKQIDPSKSTMLFLHGGPGMVVSPILDEFLVGFEEFCNLVIWDQRGAGLSYHDSIDPKTMNLANLVEDTKEVANRLKSDFGINNITILGHSWGSTLGIYTVHKHPELFQSFISLGQWLIDDESSINARIEAVREIAKADTKISQNLSIIVDSIKENFYWTDDILLENGYELTNLTNTWDYQMGLVQNSELYSTEEKANYSKGMEISEHLYNDVVNNCHVVKDIQKLLLPSLFLVGENDLVTPKEPIRKFVEILKPNELHTELEILPLSRHYSFLDANEKFEEMIINFLQTL
jgi:pimeloyl-ACP methyl ester carboxylesterase